MLRKAALREAISFPPGHARFPARPLLHAILCITANYLPDEGMSQRNYWPAGTPLNAVAHPELNHELQGGKQEATGLKEMYRPLLFPTSSSARGGSGLVRFRLWHRRQALEGGTVLGDKGLRLLELLQAIILITASDQLNAWWLDLWQLAASCLRLAIPMRLYQSHAMSSNGPAEIGQMECGDTTDPLEQAEKDRTWWMAFLMERTTTMWSTWPLSLADDEIMTELPTRQSDYIAGYGDLIGVQSIQDPNLYANHPECHTDSLCFLIKAIKLFADSQRFFRFYQRGPHSVERYLAEPGLQILLSQVNAYRLSLPERARRPTNDLMSGGQLDVDQLAAVMLIHATLIVIAEPLVAMYTWKHDLANHGLRAIRAILSLVYDITATSYDLTRLTPSTSYIFLLAAKCLMRFVDAANQDGDSISAAVFRSEIGVFQAALRQYGERFPLGTQHAKALADLLSQQEIINRSTPSIYTQITIVEDIVHPNRIPTAVGFLRRPLNANQTISTQSASDTGHLSRVHSASESPAWGRNNQDPYMPSPYIIAAATQHVPQYGNTSGSAQLHPGIITWNDDLGLTGGLADFAGGDFFDIPNVSFDKQNLKDYFA